MNVSILSSRAASPTQRVNIGGKIRCGIKVLTRKASENAKAVDIYNKGVSAREKFTEIEKKIEKATGLTNSLYPRNTAYFNVAASDFGMPEIANLIVSLYGEKKDEDQVAYLYRFPVVFHSDDMGEVYPNQFKRYGGEPNYESHYGEDGVRYCRYLPPVTREMAADQKARRIKRPPRREQVVRGKCEPSVCSEFLEGQCRFRGRLHFYIPGVPSTGLLGMETSSEYAAEAIWSDLERIRQALGYIPKTNPNKPGAPIFWITKILEQRTYFDEHGVKKTGFQWVPKLQADIDIGGLLASGSAPQLGTKSQAPIAWLTQPKGMPEAVVLAAETAIPTVTAAVMPGSNVVSQVDPLHRLTDLVDSMELDEAILAEYLDLKVGEGWEDDTASLQTAVEMVSNLSRVGDVCARKLIGIAVAANRIGLDQKAFVQYAFEEFGKGYSRNEQVLIALEAKLSELGKMQSKDAIEYVNSRISSVGVPA